MSLEKMGINRRSFMALLSASAVVVGSGAATTAMAEAGRKKIGIIVFDGVLSSDITAPAEVFGAATQQDWFNGYEVVMIGVSGKNITTAEGLKISADATIADKMKLEAFVVPSAYNMAPLTSNKKLVDFISAQAKHASWVGSNCSGAQLLAATGLLDGRKATTWAGGEDEFQKLYKKVKVQKDTNVVVDGKYITSNGSVVSYEAALTMLTRLSNKDNAKKVAEIIQYNRFNAKATF